MGAEVTGVCSTRNVELVRSLGADVIIDYTLEDFTRTGRHYDVLLDNVGNRKFSALRRIMNPRGRCVLVGVPKQVPAVLARLAKAFVRPPFLPQKFTLFIAKLRKDDLAALRELVATGRVTPVIDRRYQLSGTADAIAYVEQGHACAKVLVSVE